MKISHTIVIKSSAERVFYWLGDPSRAMEWMTSVTKYEIINKTPDWVGTTFSEYIEENGRGTEMRGVVTEFEENKQIGMFLEGDAKEARVFRVTDSEELGNKQAGLQSVVKNLITVKDQ